MATKRKIKNNTEDSQDGWSDWGNHVLAELVRLNKNFESIQETNAKMKIEIAMLNVKSGVYGAIGAAVTILPTLFYFWMKQGS